MLVLCSFVLLGEDRDFLVVETYLAKVPPLLIAFPQR
jgi:hypothetical protein